MNTYLSEIIADADWRVSELATIKTLPFRYKIADSHKETLLKYSVPSIYSLWEGFIKTSFTTYSRFLDSCNIKRNEIQISLLTHQLDSICQFGNNRNDFSKKIKLVGMIDTFLSTDIKIQPFVPTESNVNFSVLTKICERFCVPPIDNKFKRPLDKLLLFRNTISHGENSLTVEKKHIEEFTKLVQDLMTEMILKFEFSILNKTYLNG